MRWRTPLISVPFLLIALGGLYFIALRDAELGLLAPALRALISGVAILSFAIALAVWVKPRRVQASIIGVAVLLIAGVSTYLVILLPAKSYPENPLLSRFDFSQLDDQLITDSSSNGIIEVGFSYPIYTPAVEVRNNGVFTERVNLFLRLTDENGEDALFRAVRETIQGSALSVESSVQGLLSRNDDYLFIPLRIPPASSVSGRVAFVISNLEEGTSFTDALDRASAASLELREPETGELIQRLSLE